MSLTYIVLNLLLQNELKPRKMQSDTGQFQQQHHPLLLLLQMQLMKVQIVTRQTLRKLENETRELENNTRELENNARELENNVRKLDNSARQLENTAKKIKKFVMKE